MSKEASITELTKELNAYREQYYNHSISSISDYEYDMKLKALEKLEKETGFQLHNSPTIEVGATAKDDKFKKLIHPVPMLSLENSFDAAGIEDMIGRATTVSNSLGKSLELLVEPKLDGMSLSLEYDNGKLQRAVTRGDGVVGEDVTENALKIKSIPCNIPYMNPVLVRGEVLMQFDEFARVNKVKEEKGEDIYANPRNLAAGTMRAKDPTTLDHRELTFVAFDLIELKDNTTQSQVDVKTALVDLNFMVVYGEVVSSVDSVSDTITRFEETTLTKLPFPVDGLVFKVVDKATATTMGHTNKYPKWAMAYKFPAERVTTTLKDVTYQVGRMGRITPVAHVAPVELAGTVVRRATLHNFAEIKRKDIRVGDKVFIEKAGEIIPKIVKPIKSVRTGKEIKIEVPKTCPVCGSTELYISDDMSEVKCTNPKCPGINARRIAHFISRDAMNIDGLGPQTVEALLKAKLIETYKDIYKIYKNGVINKLAQIEGFGLKSVLKLKVAIEQSKNRELWHTLYALGLPYVGRTVSKLLEKEFKSIDNIMNASVADIQKINGIGTKAAHSLTEFSSKQENIDLIKELKSYGLTFKSKEADKNTGSILKGKTFVITGSFDGISRREIKKLILSNGGKVTGAISSNTDMLIVGDKAGKSKTDKAIALNVTTGSLQDLYEQLKQ